MQVGPASVGPDPWTTYQSLVAFAEKVRRDQRGLGPRDMIDT